MGIITVKVQEIMTAPANAKFLSSQSLRGNLPAKGGFFPCEHKPTRPDRKSFLCQACGIRLYKGDVRAYKTTRLSCKVLFDGERHFARIISAAETDAPRLVKMEYTGSRASAISWLFERGRRLQFGHSTLHLAVNFLDSFYKKRPNELPHTQLMAAASLVLAGKAIELDRRVPNMSKLRSMVTFNVDQLKGAEGRLCSTLEWRLQRCTFYDVLEAFLCQGVVFSSDMIAGESIEQSSFAKSHSTCMLPPMSSTSSICNDEDEWALCEGVTVNAVPRSIEKENYLTKINGTRSTAQLNSILRPNRLVNERRLHETLWELEDRAPKLAAFVIKDPTVYDNDARTLASACVSVLRRLGGIEPVWCNSCQELTGVAWSRIEKLSESIWQRFGNILSNNPAILNTNSSVDQDDIVSCLNVPTEAEFLKPASSVLNTITHHQNKVATGEAPVTCKGSMSIFNRQKDGAVKLAPAISPRGKHADRSAALPKLRF
eukprot:TRINITY_DN5279_c0_g2_i2.p1 TRINITY_DN5279_c0_g2~~TRINITY_DN5279_c0_g2_i2.p1  ORF type:complete len:487 (-),score=76.91 TRINITY_DN5279_c0_g2_i2:111-1571(-)